MSDDPAIPVGPPWRLSTRSRQRLHGVHENLVHVIEEALRISPIDITVLEGLRSRARQAELLRQGATWTMESRHLTGDAVDLAPLLGDEIRWDWPLYLRLANAMRRAAAAVQVPVRWGGTWKRIDTLTRDLVAADLHQVKPDGPHFELPR